MIALNVIREYAKSISPEDIGRAHKCFEANGTPFYMVESSRDALVEHKVCWSKEHGFTCTCESGQRGFSNCRKGVCQHAIIAVAASAEEQAAMKEQIALNQPAPVSHVSSTEQSAPAWILNHPVASHMQLSPCEK